MLPSRDGYRTLLPGATVVGAFVARSDAGIEEVTVIGDALAPATIAHATYAGRRYGEECDALPPAQGVLPFRREITGLLPG